MQYIGDALGAAPTLHEVSLEPDEVRPLFNNVMHNVKLMLHNGRVLEIGTREQIKESSNPLVQQFIKGETEGPINFMDQGDEYLQDLVES